MRSEWDIERACRVLWESLVDRREAWREDDEAWQRLVRGEPVDVGLGIWNEADWEGARRECRALAVENEFAINGHENRISYLVGCGHIYRVSVKKGCVAPAELALEAQAWIDEFLRENQWGRRQREIVRRRDRDGEAFLRMFVDEVGRTRVRFVEPEQVHTPVERSRDSAASWGVLTERNDVEQVLAYFVDGETVPAHEIQHRKGNVDCNVKRGLPLFYPVRKNLRRAERLLRNMSTLAEMQAAIALIRKHPGRTRSAVRQFVDEGVAQAGNERVWKYAPGTILDVDGGTEYEFPAARLNAANLVLVLQAELRAIASRLVMPEFMLTSDASNGSYASTLVAEGPAMKMFERLQGELIEEDRTLLWQVLRNGVQAGSLRAECEEYLELQATGPALVARDKKQEAEVRRIEFDGGILSRQTWSRMSGLDYDQEQRNLRAEAETNGSDLG